MLGIVVMFAWEWVGAKYMYSHTFSSEDCRIDVCSYIMEHEGTRSLLLAIVCRIGKIVSRLCVLVYDLLNFRLTGDFCPRAFIYFICLPARFLHQSTP